MYVHLVRGGCAVLGPRAIIGALTLHVDKFRFCFPSFEIYSIDSSKMNGKSPAVLHFQPVISRTQPVHLQLTTGSHRT